MTERVPRPDRQLTDPRELLLGFLDYYRSAIAEKLSGLSEQELRTSRLPSGWAPLELGNHLVHVEQRWFRWGFLAEQLPDPWADLDEDRRWRVTDSDTAATVIEALHAAGRRTREIVEAAEPGDIAAVGGRFTLEDPKRTPPTLIWTLAYVLQEYARHMGHLDVARELADGATGE
jgi:hypothetical protein